MEVLNAVAAQCLGELVAIDVAKAFPVEMEGQLVKGVLKGDQQGVDWCSFVAALPRSDTADVARLVKGFRDDGPSRGASLESTFGGSPPFGLLAACIRAVEG